MTYDLIIRGGTVVDGTNAAPVAADVGIIGGKIAAIGDLAGAEAAKVIDAAGKIVCPGFVDIHSHSDICPLVPYLPESKIYQGVTSELGGNCGISILPCCDERREEIEKYCASELEIPMLDTRIVTDSVADYDAYLEKRPASSNYGLLIGHGTLRGCIMGFEDRDPTADELAAMEERLESEMRGGAFGMSLGLAYPPSVFAKTDELVALAKIVAKYDGILAVHMRDETAGVVESVQEMIDIAEKTGVHVQISHLKVMQKNNWHLFEKEIALIDEANACGLRVTCDQYPYIASALALSAFLPHWAHDGGMEAMMERVHRPTEKMLAEMAERLEGRGGSTGIVICSTRGVREDWEGLTIQAIADSLGMEPVPAVLEILKTCGTEVFVTTFAQDINIVRRIFCRDDVATASDGFNLSLSPEITKDKLHPRNFGTFPHAIEWARDEKLLPLETVIYKITGLPAKMMGLKHHGTLEVGKAADITIFDHAKVADRATYSDPMQKPEGIETVIVAGEVILRDGKITDAKPGRALLLGRD